VFRHLNSGQNQNIRRANELFENVTKLKYLGMTLTDQNDIHDEIKSRLDSGMFAIIQSKIFVFPSHIKTLKIKICITVIFPVALYGCETWSVTLGEEHGLIVFENKSVEGDIWT
jgi:hypothetical protein